MNLLFHLAVNLIEYYHDYAGIYLLGEDSIIGGSLRLPMWLTGVFWSLFLEDGREVSICPLAQV